MLFLCILTIWLTLPLAFLSTRIFWGMVTAKRGWKRFCDQLTKHMNRRQAQITSGTKKPRLREPIVQAFPSRGNLLPKQMFRFSLQRCALAAKAAKVGRVLLPSPRGHSNVAGKHVGRFGAKVPNVSNFYRKFHNDSIFIIWQRKNGRNVSRGNVKPKNNKNLTHLVLSPKAPNMLPSDITVPSGEGSRTRPTLAALATKAQRWRENRNICFGSRFPLLGKACYSRMKAPGRPRRPARVARERPNACSVLPAALPGCTANRTCLSIFSATVPLSLAR